MKEKYSGKQIIKAGEYLLDDKMTEDEQAFTEATDILSYWRFSHESALENAFILLQEVSLKHEKDVLFAKRLKRLVSIVIKLRRFRQMKLKNMQDIGGCRVIVSNEKKLRKIVKDLKKKPEFNSSKKYKTKDYIKNPKKDGYRSYHIVGKFPDGNNSSKSIEIQLRTKIQHYWATALEIVDIFAGQALKSNLGNKDWTGFFINVSKQFAIMENIHLFESIAPVEKQKAYNEVLDNNKEHFESCIKAQDFSRKLKVTDRFEAFAGSLQVIESRLTNENLGQGYVLLVIDIPKSTVSSTFYPSEKSNLAEEQYIASEKKSAEGGGEVVALVSTSAVSDIREVYPNYFADSTEFLKYYLFIHNVKTPRNTNMLEKLFSVDRLGDLKNI